MNTKDEKVKLNKETLKKILEEADKKTGKAEKNKIFERILKDSGSMSSEHFRAFLSWLNSGKNMNFTEIPDEGQVVVSLENEIAKSPSGQATNTKKEDFKYTAGIQNSEEEKKYFSDSTQTAKLERANPNQSSLNQERFVEQIFSHPEQEKTYEVTGKMERFEDSREKDPFKKEERKYEFKLP